MITPPRLRTPSDAEINAAAIALDVIKPGERLRPRDRAKVAKTIQIAEQLPDEDDEDELATSDPIALIAQTHADLIKPDSPTSPPTESRCHRATNLARQPRSCTCPQMMTSTTTRTPRRKPMR